MAYNKPPRLFSVVFVAAIALMVLASCPWSRWTGGRLKDIDILAEFMNRPRENDPSPASSGNTAIDPELLALADSISALPDSVKLLPDTVPELPATFAAPTRDGIILFEDYSADRSGLSRLAETLGQARGRNVRIAMVGDSYIEGDILAQDIRAGLQDRFGGAGVGYVGIFSQFPGFRASVNQASSGWEEKEVKKMKNDSLHTILGHYHIARSGAESRFKGSVKPAHADHWQRTRVIFQSPSSGTITFSGSDNMNEICAVEASPLLQEVTLDAPTGSIRITTDIVGLKVLGVWLENTSGIVLDDISLRGNSGLSHRNINSATTAGMRRWVDYDLIVLEFGLNVVSVEQTDYSVYGRSMTEVVNNLKSLYPNAQILIMGVGDRATKINGELRSMPTLDRMVATQRDLARRTGSLFYDTRAAMGGPGAAIEWNTARQLNSDYVHLNHKGGRRLADIMLQSLDKSLQ